MNVNEVLKNGSRELVTVDLNTKEVKRKSNSADSVLPHPLKNWTAVRAKTPDDPSTTTILIYNMDTKEKVSTSLIPEGVRFWTWVNPNLLGIVGNSSVYHISIENVTGKNNAIKA